MGASDFLSWTDELGAIEPGHFADRIAVAGNPLDDIQHLENMKFVMKGVAIVENDLPKP